MRLTRAVVESGQSHTAAVAHRNDRSPHLPFPLESLEKRLVVPGDQNYGLSRGSSARHVPITGQGPTGAAESCNSND